MDTLASLSLSLSLTYYLSPSAFAGWPTGTSMWRGPLKNVTYEFILASPTGLQMSCSSYLDGFFAQLAGAVKFTDCTSAEG